MLFTRCLPRSSNGLAVMSATLGSFYWLGFETSGLSPDKKRLAYLGAQRFSPPDRERGTLNPEKAAMSGSERRLVRPLDLLDVEQ